jgi:hypothetical protein
MHSASKHAVRGYTDALRMELEKDDAPICITLIKPSSINTPFIEHARSHLDVEPEYSPTGVRSGGSRTRHSQGGRKAVRDITVWCRWKAAEHDEHACARLTDVFQEAIRFRFMKSDRPIRTHDALDNPQHDRLYGPTERHTFKRGVYTRAASSNTARIGSIVAGSLFVAALFWRKWPRECQDLICTSPSDKLIEKFQPSSAD